MDMSSENYIVTFYSSGKIEAPDFPCSGEYFFEKNKAGDDGDHKLSASFDKCKSSQAFWYTINGNADARIVDRSSCPDFGRIRPQNCSGHEYQPYDHLLILIKFQSG